MLKGLEQTELTLITVYDASGMSLWPCEGLKRLEITSLSVSRVIRVGYLACKGLKLNFSLLVDCLPE